MYYITLSGSGLSPLLGILMAYKIHKIHRKWELQKKLWNCSSVVMMKFGCQIKCINFAIFRICLCSRVCPSTFRVWKYTFRNISNSISKWFVRQISNCSFIEGNVIRYICWSFPMEAHWLTEASEWVGLWSQYLISTTNLLAFMNIMVHIFTVTIVRYSYRDPLW